MISYSHYSRVSNFNLTWELLFIVVSVLYMKLSKYIKTRLMIVHVISVLIKSHSAGYICLGRHTPGGMFHMPIRETVHSQHHNQTS